MDNLTVAEKAANDAFENAYNAEYREEVRCGLLGEPGVELLRSTFISGYYAAMADISKLMGSEES